MYDKVIVPHSSTFIFSVLFEARSPHLFFFLVYNFSPFWIQLDTLQYIYPCECQRANFKLRLHNQGHLLTFLCLQAASEQYVGVLSAVAATPTCHLYKNVLDEGPALKRIDEIKTEVLLIVETSNNTSHNCGHVFLFYFWSSNSCIVGSGEEIQLLNEKNTLSWLKCFNIMRLVWKVTWPD